MKAICKTLLQLLNCYFWIYLTLVLADWRLPLLVHRAPGKRKRGIRRRWQDRPRQSLLENRVCGHGGKELKRGAWALPLKPHMTSVQHQPISTGGLVKILHSSCAQSQPPSTTYSQGAELASHRDSTLGGTTKSWRALLLHWKGNDSASMPLPVSTSTALGPAFVREVARADGKNCWCFPQISPLPRRYLRLSSQYPGRSQWRKHTNRSSCSYELAAEGEHCDRSTDQ